MKIKTLTYDTHCGRCGNLVHAGEEIIYVRFKDTNPLLAGKKNPRVFHIDRFCDKKEENDN